MSFTLIGAILWDRCPPATGKMHTSIFGEAIDYVIEDAEGYMWVVCEDEPQASKVNFHPITGEPAKRRIDGTTWRIPTAEEKAAQAAKCSCRGLDEMCPCQNVIRG